MASRNLIEGIVHMGHCVLARLFDVVIICVLAKRPAKTQMSVRNLRIILITCFNGIVLSQNLATTIISSVDVDCILSVFAACACG